MNPFSRMLVSALVSISCSATAQESPGRIVGYNIFLEANYENVDHGETAAAVSGAGDLSGTRDETDGFRLSAVGQGRLNIARDLYLVAGPTFHYAELSGNSKGTASGKRFSVDTTLSGVLVGAEGGLEGWANNFIRLQGVLGFEGLLSGSERISGTLDGARVSDSSDLESLRQMRLAFRTFWLLSENASLGVEPAWVRGRAETEGDGTDFGGFSLGLFFGLHFQ